jgi:hypothetical protein
MLRKRDDNLEEQPADLHRDLAQQQGWLSGTSLQERKHQNSQRRDPSWSLDHDHGPHRHEVASLVRGHLTDIRVLFVLTTDLIPRGCVTPPVIHNWWEEAEQDFDRIDGLDEVPAEVQETVKRALQQGHVDDADFDGVCCRSLLISSFRIEYLTNSFTGRRMQPLHRQVETRHVPHGEGEGCLEGEFRHQCTGDLVTTC